MRSFSASSTSTRSAPCRPRPRSRRSSRTRGRWPGGACPAIDRVLERPEFVDFWALKWGDLLRINRDQLNEKGMWSFYNWIRTALRENKPVDEFVRDIVTAEGSTYTEGPANYYRTANNAADWAETTSQLFLGVRMQCAKCHH